MDEMYGKKHKKLAEEVEHMTFRQSDLDRHTLKHGSDKDLDHVTLKHKTHKDLQHFREVDEGY